MAKFYLTSGEVQFMVTAVDAEGAALWMINLFVDRTISPAGQGDSNDEGKKTGDMIDYIESLDCFDEQIMISEIGFGRDEAGLLDTEIIFMHWFQLSSALDSLLDRFES